MKITYQGQETETEPTTLAAFLTARGVNIPESVVECDGEILIGARALAAPLAANAVLNVFRIVAGG